MTTIRIHIKTLLLLALLLLSCRIFGQPMVWNSTFPETVVFELTNEEALSLLEDKFQQKHWDKVLQTPFARFTDTWTDQPAKGHFLMATIERNKVHYQYTPIIPFNVFFFNEYGMLTLQVVDAKGVIRKDAKVCLNGRTVRYDEKTKTYTSDNRSRKRQHLLTVELDNFRAIFDLNKKPVLPWSGNHRKQDRQKFYSYMITDKNKYRPGETVRFKSYALSRNRQPLNEELSLWIFSRGTVWSVFKKLQPVVPYHPGGFTGEFQLEDSLELKLDKKYTIQLRDQKGLIVASTGFSYEDYDLKDSKLVVELDSDVQYFPRSNRVNIAATDVNGLPLRETNVEVTIGRQQVLKSYADVLVLPDTLMSARVELDASGKASVDIPSEIFGASDCFYSVDVALFTVDNQLLEKQYPATFYYANHGIRCDTQADSVIFSFTDLGVERSVEAELSYGEKQEVKKVRLPYCEPFDQTITEYRIKVPEAEYETCIHSTELDSKLKLNGGIEKDSFCVSLSNPLQLDVSWYVYRGNKLLQKGSGKEMEFKSGNVDPSSVYYAEVFYFIGDEERALKRSYSYHSSHLTIETDLPERVYPGQKVTTKLNVKNMQGHPVADVDLTAFAVNSQLDYDIPDLPDYGEAPQPRELQSDYAIENKEYVHTTVLDFDRWNRLLHLDRMPHYQFAYPSYNLFRYAVDTPDGTTQFAPYVMKDGVAVKIYVIEQNNIPCYFSWSEQPKTYAFLADRPQGKQKLTLRMHDRAFIIDSIAFEPGKKTILSFDVDHLPKEVETVWFVPTKDKSGENRYVFTEAEKERYEQYLCRLPVTWIDEYTCLESPTDFVPVSIRTSDKLKDKVLVGPVKLGRWKYRNGVTYKHEGGFLYEFEGNVVYKYKDDDLCPRYLYFSTSGQIPVPDEFCLNREDFYKLVDAYRNGKNWCPTSIYLSLPDKQLCFRLPEDKDSIGVANLLFEDCTTGTMLYPDVSKALRMYSKIPSGTYNTILVYNNGKYLKLDSLLIKPYTYVDVDMKTLFLHECDSLSSGWRLLGEKRGPIGNNSFRPQNQNMNDRQVKYNLREKVCGYVLDSSGEPLIRCSVSIKGTLNEVFTDLNGYFELNCGNRTGNLLQFDYPCYKLQEKMVRSGTSLVVVMEEKEDLSHLPLLPCVCVPGNGESKIYGAQSANPLVSTLAGLAAGKGKERDGQKAYEEEQSEKQEIDTERLYSELMQLNGLRRNFSDVAFWQPRLYTDENGEAQFDITFPDNITKWQAVVYAMNQRLQTGTFRRSIRSYKPLMAELKTPRFLIDGDQTELVGMIRNYLEGQQIEGKVQFSMGKDNLKQGKVNLTEGYHEKLPVLATGTDSLTMSYLFIRDDGYRDGEEYTIPVLLKGTEVEQGTLEILSDKKTVEVRAGEDEEMMVSITDNPLDIYKESINYLVNYKYLCNEQLASRLMGLLAYKLCMQKEGEEAKVDKAVKGIIRKLMNNRNQRELWSWWGRNGKTSFWMSAHILRALKMAKNAGYAVDLDLKGLKIEYAHVTPYRGIKWEDIEILHALSDWGVEADYSSAVKLLEPLVRQLEQREDSIAGKNKYYHPRSFLKEKLLLWEIRQRVDSVSVSDSIKRYLAKDMLGGVYCDDKRRTHYWEGNQLVNTLIAYRIIKNDSSLCHLKENMQLYILRSKQRGWNTYQASLAVATVLTDLQAGAKGQKGTTVSVSGKENKQIAGFPYHIRLAAGDRLTLSKTGNEPLLYSAYSTKRVMNASESDAFKVESVLDSDTLTAGIPVDLTVTLRVKQEGAQYVMIEVPIPAGCSYASKPAFSSGSEVHREYFKEKTVIFSENLPVGTYQFSIPLLPRYTGKYTLNPVKVELMYFPVVNANSDGKQIRITERSTAQ